MKRKEVFKLSNIKFAIIGGDKRLEYLAKDLSDAGYSVSCFATAEIITENTPTLSDAFQDASAVILPYPLTPDGVYLSAVCEQCHINLTEIFDCAKETGVKTLFAGAIKDDIYPLCASRGLTLMDYAKSESLLLRNALCTAEGALSILIREMENSIFGSHFAVIGYGRIATFLARMLKALGGEVLCAARKPDVRAQIELDGFKAIDISELDGALPSCDAIINTVPATVLGESRLRLVKDEALIIDLASAPGGVDFDVAEDLEKRVIWARSLPGKYSPKTAADIIKASIFSILSKEDLLSNTHERKGIK